MAPPIVSADVFLAVAEPRRRQILDLLREGERAVGELVERLGLAQPQVSKHLRVLKEVGLVCARKAGQRRLYSVQGAELRRVHEWVSQYERYWEHQLDRVKERAERETRRRGAGNKPGGKP
ncbi:MAG: winged helix-turn-helix transcriptional regulator [Phycisphaerales bacterium]|nr:winged helix-turn-helix transcriptional regulator [Phycisphaerales bacterium]